MVHDNRASTSSWKSDCLERRKESLKCIENNYTDKSVCRPFFDRYKSCLKEEHKRILEARGGSRKLWWLDQDIRHFKNGIKHSRLKYNMSEDGMCFCIIGLYHENEKEVGYE